MRIIEGTKRRVTSEEVQDYKTRYSWVITSPYIYENDENRIEVPVGFLTDGSTFSPDWGLSWIFHDYLYSNHNFFDGKSCTRVQADQIMIDILRNTRYNSIWSTYYALIYSYIVSLVSYYNPPGCFSTAWNSSGLRGSEFLKKALDKSLP